MNRVIRKHLYGVTYRVKVYGIGWRGDCVFDCDLWAGVDI